MHASSSGGIGVCGSSFSLSIATARGNGIGWVDDDTKREEAFLAGGLSCRDAVDGGALTFISWGISSGAVGDLLLVDLFCRWTVDFVWAASLPLAMLLLATVPFSLGVSTMISSPTISMLPRLVG